MEGHEVVWWLGRAEEEDVREGHQIAILESPIVPPPPLELLVSNPCATVDSVPSTGTLIGWERGKK